MSGGGDFTARDTGSPPPPNIYMYIYSPSNLYIKYNTDNKPAQCCVLSRVNYKSETIATWYCNQCFAEVPVTSVGLYAVRGGSWHRGWAMKQFEWGGVGVPNWIPYLWHNLTFVILSCIPKTVMSDKGVSNCASIHAAHFVYINCHSVPTTGLFGNNSY
jgi:hypothetical protein